jgi:uncharacterized protein
MIIKREAEQGIREGAKYFPVVAILGPRQSGKTTLARMLFNNYRYASLEDLDVRSAAQSDPRTFLIANKNDHGLIIDEFQYVPDLLSYIQTIVDAEQKPASFILTGSQNFLMNKAITQSLAGRVSIHTLLPLSIEELSKEDLLPDQVEDILYKGCYPAIYSKETPPSFLYKNYLQTYVERDVRDLAHVGDLTTFQTFLTLCAARIGQQLNITSLGNECGITDMTAKRWLSILEASYIIFLLRPYHTKFGKRLVKTPKLYFYDTGLACNLLRIKQEEVATHPNRGNLFESLIISECYKWYYNHAKLPNVYFWRDKVGNEVDCIIEEGQKLIPIEIKSSRTMNQRFFESLEYWNSIADQPVDNGFVIFGGSADQISVKPNLISWQSMNKIFEDIK